MAGRPTIYKEEYNDLVIDLMKEGASITEVAAEIGVSRQTIYDWQEANPEFLYTIKKGFELCEAWWERQGRKNLQNKEFSYTGWYMNMKNRFKWSDRMQTDNNVTVLPTINIPVPDEFKESE